jgi:hypothetical protein
MSDAPSSNMSTTPERYYTDEHSPLYSLLRKFFHIVLQ